MFRTNLPTEREERRVDWLSIAYGLGALLLLYYLVPLLALLVAQPPTTVLGRMVEPTVVSAALTSVTSSLVSVTVATVLGLPLAYWLARADGRRASLVTALVVLPLVLPPIVSGMILLTVVGPNTLVGSVASASGLPLTRSFAGVVLAQTFVASPFVVVTAKAAFESVDRTYEFASRSLGKGRLHTIRNVTLPLAWPGIVAGITLAFARSMGEFGATIMLAYYPRTMPVQIWSAFSTRGLDHAFPVAIVLVCVSVATLFVFSYLGSNPLD